LILAKGWPAFPTIYIEQCWIKSTVFYFDPIAPPPAPPAAAFFSIAERADTKVEVQALAREVSIITGQAGDLAIGRFETLATQYDMQINDLFEQARTG
jgi:hypothetical protein